jgi:hypothetical protein
MNLLDMFRRWRLFSYTDAIINRELKQRQNIKSLNKGKK